MINSVKIRNNGLSTNCNVKDLEIKVRGPNSTQWLAFISGTLSNPNGQNPAPMETFNATAHIAKEVELSCLNAYSVGYNSGCGLNYIGFA